MDLQTSQTVSSAPTSVHCYPGNETYATKYQWELPVYEPDAALENCKSFTVSLRYNSIPDTISLGYQRIFCRANGHFTEIAAINVEKLNEFYTAGVSFDTPATVDGFAFQPMKNPRSGYYDVDLILTDIVTQ